MIRRHRQKDTPVYEVFQEMFDKLHHAFCVRGASGFLLIMRLLSLSVSLFRHGQWLLTLPQGGVGGGVQSLNKLAERCNKIVAESGIEFSKTPPPSICPLTLNWAQPCCSTDTPRADRLFPKRCPQSGRLHLETGSE